MIIGGFLTTAEEMEVPSLLPYKTGTYEIFMSELRRFGYGFRINWKNEYLLGVYITSNGLPEVEMMEPVTPPYEQLRLPFEE